ncbi:MAG: LPXTG cell wall anchor domain-containing protein [Bryobacterales bacterium]|nr:LPXTG cell wall anchor domain-containing protein [Bryobacterales bacterium]
MDNTTMSAILWIVAGGILGLYLLRRRKRNVMSK